MVRAAVPLSETRAARDAAGVKRRTALSEIQFPRFQLLNRFPCELECLEILLLQFHACLSFREVRPLLGRERATYNEGVSSSRKKTHSFENR